MNTQRVLPFVAALALALLALAVLPASQAAAQEPTWAYCPDHDPLAWHALYDEARDCWYDHLHGDNPHEVDDVFGVDYLNVTGGDIQMWWQPPGVNPVDTARKHNGLFWLVRRGLPCESLYGMGCITDFRAEVHMLSDIYDNVRSGGAEGSYHVSRLEARLCLLSDPNACGIVRLAGRQYLGDVRVDGVLLFDVPEPRDLFGLRTVRPQSLNFYDVGNKNFTTWYPINPNNLFRIAVETSDVWAAINPADPFANVLTGGNQSRLQPHVVHVDILPRFLPTLDPDGDGIVDFSGYTDINGFFVAECTAPGPGCIPVSYEGVPAPGAVPGRSGYQLRGDYREYDTSIGRLPQSPIRYPGAPQ